MEIEKWLYFKEVDSTSSWLKLNAKRLVHNATVVWAKEQSKGRGRFERRWVSEPGGLYFSILLLPDLERVRPEDLVASFSHFLVDYAAKNWELSLWVKPPNDVYYQDKKLAGVLIENIFMGERLEACVFGVGVNVNQVFTRDFDFGSENLGYGPVSLREILGVKLDLESLLKDLVGNWKPPLG